MPACHHSHITYQAYQANYVHDVRDDTDVLCCSFTSSVNAKLAMPHQTTMSSLVQDQAVVDIHATTEAHTDIHVADVLLSMNNADTMASLHDIGKATDLKMTRKEGFSPSEIGDVNLKSQYATFIFFIFFSPFQINTQLLFLIFFHKMAAGGHFG